LHVNQNKIIKDGSEQWFSTLVDGGLQIRINHYLATHLVLNLSINTGFGDTNVNVRGPPVESHWFRIGRKIYQKILFYHEVTILSFSRVSKGVEIRFFYYTLKIVIYQIYAEGGTLLYDRLGLN
jgi:hypothetical protein